MHVGVDISETDGGVTYAGDGVVEEWVSLLEGFKILYRNGLVHVTCVGVGSAVAVRTRTGRYEVLSALPLLAVSIVFFLSLTPLWVHMILIFEQSDRFFLRY